MSDEQDPNQEGEDARPEDAAENPPDGEDEPKADAEKSSSTSAAGPQLDLSNIINETADILAKYSKHTIDQKECIMMAVFYLVKMNESVLEYTKYLKKLINFFQHHDTATGDGYFRHVTYLPRYAQYVAAVVENQAAQPPHVRCPGQESESLIAENELKNLLDNVVENVYAGGMNLKSIRKICHNMQTSLVDNSRKLNDILILFPGWLTVLQNQLTENDDQTNKVFNQMAYIDFMKTGIFEETPEFEPAGPK